ncbi:hypothetical protein KKA27_00520 [Patescibacteria group bacterium]|nr:hypothetical protein [Patescibacteria group bacterium]
MFTRAFEELSKKDVKIAGGKGASLGELTQAGFEVPPGFVVLDSKSKNIDKEILQEFDRLEVEKVAVRSSATAEDSITNSCAGQLESYLNVTKKDLLKSIQKCRDSLYSPRALTYCAERGLTNKDILVAVVVQKMVDSEKAGVCFTVHPVTQDKKQMIIEAVDGLGESLVQGIVTPDSYVINKKTFGLIDININGRQKLNETQIKKLAKICIDIEKHYKKPQDIEWALEKGKFYIVQSRPITTSWGRGLDYLLKDYWNDLDQIIEDNYSEKHNAKLINFLFPKVLSKLKKSIIEMRRLCEKDGGGLGGWEKQAKNIQSFSKRAKTLNEKVIFIDMVRQFLRATYLGDKKQEKMIRKKGGHQSDTSMIRGVVASQVDKNVKGVVKIVLSEKDFSKVRRGDILVARDTNPSFLPVMIKAKAFITDEGGILCHAAIVAREMKKPCVVATKVASRVLKDGEEVEIERDLVRRP